MLPQALARVGTAHGLAVLLLASASPARRRLLEQAAIAHRVQVSGVDEDATYHTDPAQLVQLLAKAKAQAVRDACTDASITAVLGCDSVLAFEGEVFGKPIDAAEAIARWQRMAGGWGSCTPGTVCWRWVQRGSVQLWISMDIRPRNASRPSPPACTSRRSPPQRSRPTWPPVNRCNALGASLWRGAVVLWWSGLRAVFRM